MVFLAWPHEVGAQAPRPRDVTIEELVKDWNAERNALKRRTRLRVIRTKP